jgi:hypothetical protein
MSFLAASVCLVACHGGPADHFATFATELTKAGHSVQIYASGPALKKLQERQVRALIPFSTDDPLAALKIARQCSAATVVITDVGHVFDLSLHEALSRYPSKVRRLAYYDNPEPYVPGGYSEVAAKVMRIAQEVLFANATLATSPVFEAPGQEISLLPTQKIGLGFSPLDQAKKIADRRARDQAQLRSHFFAQRRLADQGQKIFVYTGGNNEEYFTRAFPALLQFISAASQQQDLSHLILLLQQHPGAKQGNRDGTQLQEWLSRHKRQASLPTVAISDLTSDDAQVLADGILYNQTSMAPLFVLAGIPTFQVGPEPYPDLLVKNHLCITVTSGEHLRAALTSPQARPLTSEEAIQRGLGFDPNWAQTLIKTIQKFEVGSNLGL